MIVVDTNVFVRYLAAAVGPTDEPEVEEARALFAAAALGDEQFTTNDAVIAELLDILQYTPTYGFARPDIGERLGALLALPGCRLPHKQRVLAALALWVERPRLGFVDALTLRQAMEGNDPLATFDETTASFPGVRRWRAAPN